MKTPNTLIVVLFLIFSTKSISAQVENLVDMEYYPKEYTFEKAERLKKSAKIQEALWFYINLFPDHKEKVVNDVKLLEKELDTLDLGTAILLSFTIYGTFDPAISSLDNGALSLNIGELNYKSAWADELIHKVTDLDKPLNSAAQYNFRGLDYANLGQYENAIESFDRSIKMKPSGQVYFNRAYSKTFVSDFEGAILDFSKAEEMSYRLKEVYFERGYCKDQLKDFKGAIKDYSEAIQLDSTNFNAFNNRAYSKMNLKDFKGALIDFNKGIELNPSFAGAYVNRGFAKKNLGNQKGACEDWNKAWELGFKNVRSLIVENCN